MSDSAAAAAAPAAPSIARPGAPPGGRRTKFMIEQENERILDYIRSGATDRQIMQWVGLTHRNYRKRIYMLQKQDMEQTLAEQKTEARAFTYQRMIEKIHHLEIRANQMLQNTTTGDKDRIEAMKFLLQVYEDEYSLKEFGASRFLNSDAALPGPYQQKAMEYRAAFAVAKGAEAKQVNNLTNEDDSGDSTSMASTTDNVSEV